MVEPQVNLVLASCVVIASVACHGEAAETPKRTSELEPERVSTKVITGDNFYRWASWQECFEAAESGRSQRDLDFFISASKLINAKPWFVSHSRASEERFCKDVARCEELFEKNYVEANGAYAPCHP
jgi:hypothetical protein